LNIEQGQQMASQDIVINVQGRSESGKGHSRRLRAEGMVPAVIYGHGHDALGLTVAETDI
jgi:large subunit ribosomal protein L25